MSGEKQATLAVRQAVAKELNCVKKFPAGYGQPVGACLRLLSTLPRLGGHWRAGYGRVLPSFWRALAIPKHLTGNTSTMSLLVFSDGTHADGAKVIKTQLAQIGVGATIEELEEALGWKRCSAATDICAFWLVPRPRFRHPHQLCVGTDGGLNVSFYSNEEVDSLLAQVRVITGEAELRRAL